jgi:hypothetical protein
LVNLRANGEFLLHWDGIGSARCRKTAYAEVLAQDIRILSVRETDEALAGSCLRRRQRHAGTDELRPCRRHYGNTSSSVLHSFQCGQLRACNGSVTAGIALLRTIDDSVDNSARSGVYEGYGAG